MKKLFRRILMVTAMFSFAVVGCCAIAPGTDAVAATKTYQAPAAAVVTAEPDGKGNVVVSWTEPIKIATVEHYVGHGEKSGFVKVINVGAAKKAVLVKVAKNGARFNLKTVSGAFLHLECGGNDRTMQPKLVGCEVDCSYIDPDTGQPAGALVAK